MGCLNMSEVERRDEIGCMFEECTLEILGFTETKLRGKGYISFGALERINLRGIKKK